MAALMADMILVAVLVTVGVPGMTPIPLTFLALVFSYVMVLSLTLNDRVKHVLMGRFGIAA